jgi:hypothetical protein
MAYNQYGALLDGDVQDFALSCDDNIGVCDGKVFTAAASVASGNLTVTVGGVTYTAPLQVVAAEVAVRLDSVIVDQDIDYAIEVLSGDMLVNPAALTWSIDDPTIVAIDENGVLNGLQNGRTVVRCELDGKEDSLLVVSEINEPKMPIAMSEFEIKAASSKWNTTLIPATETDNAKLTFSYSVQRNPYIQLNSGMRLYSLPKAISLTLNTNTAKFSSVMFAVKANNEPTTTYVEKEGIQSGVEQTIELEFADVLNTSTDISTYPLVLDYIKFNISTEIEKMDHVVDIKVLQLIYDEIVVELEDVVTNNGLVVYPNPTSDYIVVEGKDGEYVSIYDLGGKCVYQSTMQGARCSIDSSVLSAGTYVVKCGSASCKVIVK